MKKPEPSSKSNPNIKLATKKNKQSLYGKSYSSCRFRDRIMGVTLAYSRRAARDLIFILKAYEKIERFL